MYCKVRLRAALTLALVHEHPSAAKLGPLFGPIVVDAWLMFLRDLVKRAALLSEVRFKVTFLTLKWAEIRLIVQWCTLDVASAVR